MIRQSTKRRVEALLARSRPSGARQRVVVLCYHSIHPSLPFASASPDLFRQHLRWLDAHCDVVPLGALATGTPRTDGARPIVALTFDDGYADNYTYAFPLLKEAGLPATFFLATGLVEADPEVIRTLSVLCEVGPEAIAGLSWSQVREMRRGGMEFGAHTHAHRNLSYIGRARAGMDIQASKRILEAHLREPVTAFAYPFGKPGLHFDDSTVAVVAGLAFRCAVTIHYRGVRAADRPYTIPRFAVTNDPVDILAAKVQGKLDVLGLWQQWAPRPLARLVSDDRSRVLEGGHR